MQLKSMIPILAVCISGNAKDVHDHGSDAFNIVAPVTRSAEGEKDRSERFQLVCINSMQKAECNLWVLGFTCEGNKQFYYGNFNTTDGSMKVRQLDLSNGTMLFEYSVREDKFTCSGDFADTPGAIRQNSTKIKNYKFKTFSCSGFSSLFEGIKPYEIRFKLRDQKNISQLCGNIPF